EWQEDRRMKYMRLIFLSCLVLIFVATQSANGIEIAKDGAARATIITVTGTSHPERHAARELANLLKQVTGAELPIEKNGEGKRSRILIGEKSARLANPDFSVADLGSDGLIIRTVGDDLILAGGRNRGTLYAVYTFLEEYVGCRWWTPKVSFVPKKSTLAFDSLDVRYVPPLEYREPYWYSALDADWAVRNKVNGYFTPLDSKRGGKTHIEGFVHTFDHLIPPGKYFKDHPEWFSEIDGRRKQDHAQLCLSNEDMRQELVNNLKQKLRKNRRATQASVSQNDWAGYCKCERCRAIDEQEGSPAGSIIRFVNAVAADIEKDFPKVAIGTLAYQYSQRPPKYAHPRDNVVVWLCTMGCSYNLPLKTHKRNREFAKDLQDWAKIAKRLYIWDYTTNFRHYLFIHPNLRVLGPNIRFFLENNVAGVFEQGAYQSPGAEMMELRSWVLAKLLWNPTLNDTALIKEFLRGYYGPAGQHIFAYQKGIHKIMQQGGQPLGCYEGPDRKFMAIKPLTEGWAHLKAAQEAVQDNAELLHRVKVAQMPMLYAFLIKWEDLRKQAAKQGVDWPMADDPKVVLNQLKTTAKKIGVTRVSEHDKFDKLEEKLKLPK
ncbi:MAG: DUF4838 domain-containing protein, partial [Planctomycetota bacterium]